MRREKVVEEQNGLCLCLFFICYYYGVKHGVGGTSTAFGAGFGLPSRPHDLQWCNSFESQLPFP